MAVIAQLQKASKIYKSGDTVITALAPTTMDIRNGELMLIIGPSGSGKTTLLSLLGCVIYPTEGKVLINGVDTSTLNSREMAHIRSRNIGFIFQSFNLIAPLTTEENVMFPLSLLGITGAKARSRAQVALEKVGMLDKRKSLPRQLSGGQSQRAAIARALVTDPPILLCDEPTASLDSRSVQVVMEELKMLSQMGKAVIIVTHDHRLETYADKIVTVENGIVSGI